MVVADYQDDVVPVEDSHHLKPDVGLVRVRWHRSQKGQVDALQGRTRAQHGLGGWQPPLQGQGWRHKAIWGTPLGPASFLVAGKQSLGRVLYLSLVKPERGKGAFLLCGPELHREVKAY